MKEHDLNPEDFILDEIESIQLLGDRPTIDITVADTHMFFANDVYTHNSGAGEDIVQAHNVSDSYRKIMTADFVMSASRNISDKANSTARMHIIKNRFGPDGITLYSKMDTGNGDIRIYDEKSAESSNIKSNMESDDGENDVKKQLSSKWRGYRKDDFGNNKDL